MLLVLAVDEATDGAADMVVAMTELTLAAELEAGAGAAEEGAGAAELAGGAGAALDAPPAGSAAQAAWAFVRVAVETVSVCGQ